MAELIILRGLPASGKNTWAYAQVQDRMSRGDMKVTVVCRDDLRRMAGLGVAPSPYEPTVTFQQHALVRAGLKAGHTVISADTNLRASTVKDLAEIGEFFGASVEVIDIDTPVDECIRRDKLRGENGGHSVGEDVILKFYKKYFVKGRFPKNPIGSIEPVVFEPYVPNTSLRKAFIIDIDGTIANNQPHRSPFDYTKVSMDWPHRDVIEMVENLHALDYKVIFMSGREDSCKRDTLNWLSNHTILTVSEYDTEYTCPLFMRPAGDKRADFIVKNELFDKHVKDKYNVVGAIDDRKQVIDAYRARGIRVYDVAGHTF